MSRKRAILRWLRRGAAVLILAALVWLGYRQGHRVGHGAATPPPTPSAGELLVVSYPVGDLLDSLGANSPGVQPPDPGGPAAPDADFDRLIDLVVSTIDVESWQRNGTGEGEIMPFPRNSSLVVSQTRRVHQQIAELLEQLRSISVTVKAEEIIPFIQSRAAHGQAGDPQALRVLPRNAHGEAVMEGLFQEAVVNTSAIWGVPDFRGTDVHESFPAWATARQIAVWARGGGLAYLAVQHAFEGQTQLVAGWRPAE